MLKFKSCLLLLIVTLLCGINPVYATEQPAVLAQKIYTFHTALQSPIKEILDTRIKEAFSRLGLKAEVQIHSSSQRALILANEDGDGDAGRVTHIKTIAPDNTSNLIQISEPIITLTLNVYTKNLDFPVVDWNSLQKYHNGARVGAKILEKNIPGKTIFLPTTVQLVQMLDSGRIDTMVEWDLIADHAIKNLNVKLKKLAPPIIVQPFHIYLHKKHQKLVPKLNKVLRQMKEEGALASQTTDFVFYTGLEFPIKEILEKRLQEAFKRVGDFKVKLVNPGSSQRALVLANEEGDGDANRVFNIKELAPTNTTNLIRIPEPMNLAQFAVYSNGTVSSIENYESLTPYRNGFRRGVKILEKYVPGERIILPDTGRLLQMLNDGRIDTVTEWPRAADKIIKEKKYPNIVKLSTPLINMPLYTYIHKRHQALIPKLAQALQEMKQDGTFEQIKIDVVKQAQP